jgi:hypothetical protein
MEAKGPRKSVKTAKRGRCENKRLTTLRLRRMGKNKAEKVSVLEKKMLTRGQFEPNPGGSSVRDSIGASTA